MGVRQLCLRRIGVRGQKSLKTADLLAVPRSRLNAYRQGRRHDFKSEGDKTWFASEASGQKIVPPPTLGKVGVQLFPRGGYDQATNYQFWIHWNLLPGCRINKYVIGLYCSIMNQRRREFHVSAESNIYEGWNRSHGPLVARCAWIMLRCAMCTKPFWTRLISRNWCRNLFWEKTIVDHHGKCFNLMLIIQNVLLKWFDEW